MVKSQKKRNKKYSGVDAKSSDNIVRVHRVNAVVRSDFKQWVYEHQKLLKRVGIAILIVGIIVFLIVNAVLMAK
ncbi:hypothetical protein FWF74_02465 [Candidatus Saccharibacteria bacterium]|nr:hypothetical protein [Candidatus Saccharibacteria bacterium]MCL1962714.1 hypothetical protein [Candidatus Saccharibacteria bacterium]